MKSGRMKSGFAVLVLGAICLTGIAAAQSDSGPTLDPAPTAKKPKRRMASPDQPGPTVVAPRSDDRASERPVRPADPSEESSSRNTLIDLSPPKNDAKDHPGAEMDLGVNEFHPYDPHKAMKNVEVGDYYAKRKNLAAAISRYREALQYKPKDAEATFKLAEALERSGESEEAAEDYQAYLKITPHGDFAEQAKKALQRLNEKSGNSASADSAPKPKS